ncbi:MAG: Asp-tRNA(Asn)/Glu-tRNA(Gln) amidotransferase subunit GatA [Ferruginibacter sp.]|nr:Asp-tRNA(Asn)/Glu-tRNA(Gln) amidotransferase subunit GatA [Cytophagales bacterium]
MKAYHSLSQIQADLQTGSVNCRQLVEHYLFVIGANTHLNAFLAVYDQEALRRADEIDRKVAQGTQGKLAGLVVGIKDVLCYRDHGAQASSRILRGFISQFTGTAVQRLLDADAIIIGRQNCDEFAMGSSNENSAFGPVFNAADPARVPGGSSGGSAVAVQAGMCLASLGSDTGGSVRQPAALCGIVGLKPTYSRISRYGLIAYASSFDTIGTLTRNVEDAARLLEVIAGEDEYDSTVSKRAVPAYSQHLSLDRKLKLAYIRETVESKVIDPEVRQRTFATLDFLRGEGHAVEAVDFPLLEHILPTYYILTTAEASSNLARFDGVKYGYRSVHAQDLESMYKKTRTEAFGEEVKRRIILGTFVLSADYYDAYYTKAQKVRRIIKEKTDEILSEYDFLVLPTTPTTAFRIGERSDDPLQMYLADVFSVQANVVGIPAISVPNGSDARGLPIGLQIMASNFREAELMAFAAYVLQKQAAVEA